MIPLRILCAIFIFTLSMKSTDELIEIIRKAISAYRFKDQPAGLYEPLAYAMSLGGKRVRPLLCLLAYNLYKEDVETALMPALGVEFFHNFTLLHDDVMDRSFIRRGQPCVHVKWDENTAILSGDALQVVAYQLVAQAPAACLKECLDLFSQTALEVCEGQSYDMLFESRQDVAEDEYLEMIRLKTAVLLAGSLKMGAIVAGAPASDAQHLYDFGIHIGIAFQIKDDLLDVWGNPAIFGKAIGGDIMCNKKTFLLIHALKYADEDQRRELLRYMSSDDIDRSEKVQAVTELYESVGVRKVCEDLMQNHENMAMAALDALAVDRERTKYLRQLAESMMKRQM